MATAAPPSSSGLLPLLESLEDVAAGQSEQTDVYLTIASRLSGEEGRQFLPAVEKHFPRLAKAILAHIASPNAELSQAALQALGFCVYHSHVVSGAPAAEILSALCSLVVKSSDKNTCTRALWVISKQSFPADVVGKKVSLILSTLESMWSREDVQSVVMEHEALNVVIRMLEQVSVQMGDGAVQWARLVVPLVVHSASKVRLRAAAALELGLPLLLEKQMEVAAVIEPMMSSKLIPELQKLFMSKNEANVLKLWPLFVKLLGKLLHRGGPFINSLLHLEELGFRSSSPTIKKIAFIAWKSLIDNFALNPDILCSSKRMKLLMQPLTSINVRTEALLLTKVEVWWYLVVQLGQNLSTNFDQVSVPLLQTTIGSDSSSVPGTLSRPVAQNGAATPVGNKTGFNSPANSSRMSLNSNVQVPSCFPSIQLLGLEMLLHYFLGPDVVAAAAKNKLLLSLEPLNHPLLSGVSSFTKHAAVLISSITDGFSSVGKDAPGEINPSPPGIWQVVFVVCSKKDRQGCEVLTLMLQALQNIVASEALPADRVLVLFEATVKGIPQRVLGSASYQVGKMDVLNGTPALFLIQLLYNSSMLAAFTEDERFFQSLQTLVGCGLSGPTSPLMFSEAVLGAVSRSAASLQNKEQLLRMWSVVVGPLSDTITQSNEVNQGDALEHNFSSIHSALMLPVTHLLQGAPLQQKSLLSLWSKLYKVFARCSALVVTAEENICCEELCGRMVPSTLNSISSFLQVMVECVDFSPFTPQFQQKLKCKKMLKAPPVCVLLQLEKLLGDVLGCLQSRSTLAFNDELLVLLAPLLCVLFPHKNKQLRTSVTHFWNSTFASAVSLSYPEDLTVGNFTLEMFCVSETMMQKNRLFSEGSQMETTLSGIPVSSVEKRDSVKDRSSRKSKPVPTKLDFSSPKPPRREVLEEEASIDFVFIPPETKERVLTEHQKEVKRTKRVDIPAMYNNLDASLDTTAFSQFTQSQEDSQYKLVFDTQAYVSPKDPEDTTENQQQEEILPDSADVSMEDDDKAKGTSPNISASSDLVSGTPQKPNSRRQSFITLEKYAEGKAASPSSVSSFTGPLVKTSSQRPSSKDSQTSTGSDSQDCQTKTGNSQSSVNDVPESPRRPKESRTRTEPVKLTERLPSDSTEDEDVIPDTQTEVESTKVTSTSEEEVKLSSPEEESEAVMDDSQSSPDKPKRSRTSRVRPSLTGENSEEQDAKDISNKKKRSRETCVIESPQLLQSRPNTRSKQVAEESSGKIRLRRRPQQDESESSQSNSQGQENKRKKIRLFSSSEDFLAQPQRKRRSTSEHLSSQTDVQSQSDLESQLQGRRGRRSKASTAEVTTKDDRKLQEDSQTVELVGQTEKDGDETEKDSQLMSLPQAEGQSQESETAAKTKKDGVQMTKDSQMPLPQVEVQSQDCGPAEQTEKEDELKMDTQMSSPQVEVQPQDSGPAEQMEKDDELKTDSQMPLPQGEVQPQDFELEGQTKHDKELKKDSEMSLPQAEVQSQESEPEEKTTNEGGVSQIVISTPANVESQEGTSKKENKTTEAIDDNLSQEDSQVITPSSSVGQSIRRRRRSKLLQLSSGSTPESSRSLDLSQSESSQSRGRYSTRRSSPAVVGGVDSSESESSDAREVSLVPKRRGRKPRASLPSPLAVESKDRTEQVDSSQTGESQSTEAKTDSVEPSEAQDLLQVGGNVEEESKEESPMEVEDEMTKKTYSDDASVKEDDAKDVETLESAGISNEQTQEMFSAETLKPSEEKPKEVSETGDSDLDHQDHPAAAEDSQKESERPHVTDEVSDQQTEPTAEDKPAPLINGDGETQIVEPQHEEKTQAEEAADPDGALADDVFAESTSKDIFQDSPVKQKDLEAVMEPGLGQSPSSGRTRGTWSPSASPSTSILKRGQKRPLQDETPSPLVKSRRVSFANPIQQQETADDIDRRSPAVRTSSPRRSKGSNVPQPKISELSQEPRPVSRDCIYPALVGCSTPVEAVLPQISSNMWSRGFGQLVRARNIKTVGDLSALTPGEIKTLPIRSPKISNVRKALKVYEQQVGPRSDYVNQQPEDQRPEDLLLPSDVELLSCRMSPSELGRCSAQQLVQIHDQLGDMMRRVVVELQTRVQQTDDQH
uniref:Replication timing regulatory factor 1 n=1 Tax=Amphiprion percula TaxID=161767 RepID=A0A3P8T2Y2_AMPPE